MLPFVTTLVGAGLRLVANAALVKGKEFVEEKSGVKLDKPKLSAEDTIKLQKFQMENEEELLKLQMENNQLNLEETKAYLADVQGARNSMVAIETSAIAPWYAKAIQPALAAITVIATIALFILFVYWSGDQSVIDPTTQKLTNVPRINSTQKDIIIYILGVLSAAVTQILGYYFGSSASSARKTEHMGNALSNKQS